MHGMSPLIALLFVFTFRRVYTSLCCAVDSKWSTGMESRRCREEFGKSWLERNGAMDTEFWIHFFFFSIGVSVSEWCAFPPFCSSLSKAAVDLTSNASSKCTGSCSCAYEFSLRFDTWLQVTAPRSWYLTPPPKVYAFFPVHVVVYIGSRACRM